VPVLFIYELALLFVRALMTNYRSIFQSNFDSSPNPPNWLNIQSQIYSPQYGRGEVLTVLGMKLIVQFAEIITFPHWKEAIDSEQIMPASRAPEIETFTEIDRIGRDSFKAIARELSALHKLKHVHITPERGSNTSPFPENLPSELLDALQNMGIDRLYSHQLEALETFRSQQDLCITTDTASGKSLAYSLPVFEACIKNPEASYLFLWPLKALATDQITKLETLNLYLPPEKRLRLGLFSADVSIAERQRIWASKPHIVGMSPDFLHYQLYAMKTDDGENFRTFLSRLKGVVVDEQHSYQSVFGSSVSNVFRRLRLAVSNVNNTHPLQWIFTSATIGNPQEVARTFSGNPPPKLIEENGAKRAERILLTLNPSDVPNGDAAQLILKLMQENLTGICFCESRVSVKKILSLINNQANRQGISHLTEKIAIFYGSLSEERRLSLIRKIKSGAILWLISTNALEAGIDLPNLDVILLREFPGSLMSLKQRLGRAGRQSSGLGIFLPALTPLDYYYGSNPELLVTGKPEKLKFNPDYPIVLAKHLHAAAVESGIPLTQIQKFFGFKVDAIADALLGDRTLKVSDRGVLYARGYPHKQIFIRGNSSECITIVDERGNELESVNTNLAIRELFAGAIYSLQDDSGQLVKYLSQGIDANTKQARVKYLGDSNLFTTANCSLDIALLDPLAPPKIIPLTTGELSLTLGWGEICSSVVGYKLFDSKYSLTCINKKCQFYRRSQTGKSCSHCHTPLKMAEVTELMKEEDFLVPHTSEYQAPVVKIEVSHKALSQCRQYIEKLKVEIQNKSDTTSGMDRTLWDYSAESIALRTIGHQLIQALPLNFLNNVNDLSFVTEKQGDLTIGWFFDQCTDDTGASENLFYGFADSAKSAYSLSANCPCETGCPKCLTLHKCPENNEGLNKLVGMYLLNSIDLSKTEI
jgi:DEAD/DEAH box helicase domain-containing protein